MPRTKPETLPWIHSSTGLLCWVLFPSWQGHTPYIAHLHMHMQACAHTHTHTHTHTHKHTHTYIHIHTHTHTHTHTHFNHVYIQCTRVHGTNWNTLLLHLVSGGRHFQYWICSYYILSGYALSLYNTDCNTRMDHFQLQRQHI